MIVTGEGETREVGEQAEPWSGQQVLQSQDDERPGECGETGQPDQDQGGRRQGQGGQVFHRLLQPAAVRFSVRPSGVIGQAKNSQEESDRLKHQTVAQHFYI